jgi:hypothetical protein
VSAAAVSPILVSQDNCLAATGLEPRRFLALIHARRIPHVKLGQLRVVRADDLLAAIVAEPSAVHTDNASPETLTDRLARAAGFTS